MILLLRSQFRTTRNLAFAFGLRLLRRLALAPAPPVLLFLLFGLLLLLLGQIELFLVEVEVVGEEGGYLEAVGLLLLLLFLEFGDQFLAVSAQFEGFFALALVQTPPPFALAAPTALPELRHNLVHKDGGLFRRYFLALVHRLLPAQIQTAVAQPVQGLDELVVVAEDALLQLQ